MALNMYEQTGHTKYDIREYVCDTVEDINDLPIDIPMGSQAFVIENGAVYILSGNQTWEEFVPAGGSGGGGGLKPVVLGEGEYDPETGKPTILDPNPQAMYFVPNPDGSSTEWVYVENKWEKLGSADVDLSKYATIEYVETNKPYTILKDTKERFELIKEPITLVKNENDMFMYEFTDITFEDFINNVSLSNNVYLHIKIDNEDFDLRLAQFIIDEESQSCDILFVKYENTQMAIEIGTLLSSSGALSFTIILFTEVPAEITINNFYLDYYDILEVKDEFKNSLFTNNSGLYSTAIGLNSTSEGMCSFAEGVVTLASGDASHAEGSNTQASGTASHVEGTGSVASGDNSHAEGGHTQASEYSSHAEGYGTQASGDSQHVQGKYNIPDKTSAHIVGNGTFAKKSNAHTLDWNGNAWFAGDIYVGSTSGKNKDDGSIKVATMNDINEIKNLITDANALADEILGEVTV